MKLEFSTGEIEILTELVYLGNWLANATRLPNQQIIKYADAASNFLKKADEDFDDETMHDNVEELIQYYDESVTFKELAKQYANYHYPYNSKGIVEHKEKFERQFISNRVLKDLCKKELEENKFLNVTIKLQNLESEIEKSLKNNDS